MVLYLYFSGTGNTRFVVEQFSKGYSDHYQMISIEEKNTNFQLLIQEADEIFFAYPIYGSMMPFIMSDFINQYQSLLSNKVISTIVTQILFSGDGGSLAFYLLKNQSIKKHHSIHIHMPNNATDVFFLPTKSLQDSSGKLQKVSNQITSILTAIHNGKTYHHGRRFYSWFLGFFGQRLYAIKMMNDYRSKLKIDADLCIKCGKCITACPTQNIVMKEDGLTNLTQCTLCYRCINLCPTKAISLLSKAKPKTQFIHRKYN